MSNSYADIDEKILKDIFDENSATFLINLKNKQDSINAELEGIKAKKDSIIKEISYNKKAIEKDPKALREYISNAESVLESIDLVYKNLRKLQDIYREIEKSLVIIVEKYKARLAYEKVKDDLENVLRSIHVAKALENTIKTDNEKNYLIIDSFMDKSISKTVKAVEGVDFYNLTLENLKDNPVLKICERRVELPYTKKEIEDFMKAYPEEYKTVQDVVRKEFMINISIFNKHPILARFKEAYYLCRTKEMMSIFESFNYAKGIMFKTEINPYIVAAVKSKKQLEDYIKYLEENKLEEYPHFKIIFEVNPLKI